MLVEFESGSRDSLFHQRRGSAQMRDWGRALQHAFGQVSDWTWGKNDGQTSAVYRNAFGIDLMSETYVIVCGRDAFPIRPIAPACTGAARR